MGRLHIRCDCRSVNRQKHQQHCYDCRQLNILLQLLHIKEEQEWAAYFYFHDNIVQLSKGYVTTLHKAQGSTYKRVYVDLDSLGSCTSLSTGLSLLYVAFSRPSHELILYGNLPKRFGTIS